MDSSFWTALAIFAPLAFCVTAIGIYRPWIEYRSRTKVLDVLRRYAERGQEPPASVIEALAVASSGRNPGMTAASVPAAPKPTRANHLAHIAGSTVCGLGAVGIAWWRMPDDGEPGPLVIWAVIAAIFFAGSIAARLVGVLTTPSSGRLGDGR